MGKYLKEFELISQYEEYINSDMAILPNVSIIKDDNMVHYNPKVNNVSKVLNYLKFTAEEDNSTISLYDDNSPDIKYSLNEGEWIQWDYNDITLNMGDTVRMKGNNSNGFNTSDLSSNQFMMTGKIGASGNIMSLLYEDDFEGKLTIPCDYCFANMFMNCNSSITTAPELPATTLTNGCYSSMFYGCDSLTNAPTLPATTLTNGCYSSMFKGCYSLITTPELPATTLADDCYREMFVSCYSLTTTPELPATTLAEGCYREMFSDCYSLTTAPTTLPATHLAVGCYAQMFFGCNALTTVPTILPATTLADDCYNGMFDGCSVITTAPELPATILTKNCYSGMFSGCSELNYIKMLATDISATGCLDSWVSSVSSTGTFVKDPNMTSLPTGDSGIPTGWEVQDVA